MSKPDTDEAEKNPVGTLILMLVLAAVFLAGWGFMYFSMFMAHGPVN